MGSQIVGRTSGAPIGLGGVVRPGSFILFKTRQLQWRRPGPRPPAPHSSAALLRWGTNQRQTRSGAVVGVELAAGGQDASLVTDSGLLRWAKLCVEVLFLLVVTLNLRHEDHNEATCAMAHFGTQWMEVLMPSKIDETDLFDDMNRSRACDSVPPSVCHCTGSLIMVLMT